MVFDTGALEHGRDLFEEAAFFGYSEEAVVRVVAGHGCFGDVYGWFVGGYGGNVNERK